MLNNGCIGILFNDKSKIILSIIGITFFYIDRQDQSTRYTIYEYPEELKKKKQCLDYFIKSIKETRIFKKNQFMQNCELKEPLTFLRHKKFAGVTKMFVLNNKLVQFIFEDKSEIHIYRPSKHIIFINTKRERVVYESLNVILELTAQSEAKKRIEYIQNKFKI